MKVRENIRLIDDRLIVTEFSIDPDEGREREAQSLIEMKVKEYCASSSRRPERYTKDNDPFRKIVIEEIDRPKPPVRQVSPKK